MYVFVVDPPPTPTGFYLYHDVQNTLSENTGHCNKSQLWWGRSRRVELWIFGIKNLIALAPISWAPARCQAWHLEALPGYPLAHFILMGAHEAGMIIIPTLQTWRVYSSGFGLLVWLNWWTASRPISMLGRSFCQRIITPRIIDSEKLKKSFLTFWKKYIKNFILFCIFRLFLRLVHFGTSGAGYPPFPRSDP